MKWDANSVNFLTKAVIDFDLTDLGDHSVAHAFVLRAESAQQIQAFSAAIGLDVHAILLRHYSVASRFARVSHQPEASGLLLNLLDESADLLVVKDRQVAAARTIHYGKDSGAIQMDRLSSEVVRTVAANPSIGTVERVFVFGRDIAANDFVAAIKEGLPFDVELLDPLKETEHSGIRGDDPSFPMAALVGMVCDVQDDSAMIDFANPKQPPAPPNRWRKAAFYSLAAAAAIAIVTHTLGGDLKELDGNIHDLQSQLDHQKQVLEKLESRTLIVDAVNRWQNAGVNWLDELRDLTVRFPREGDAMVDRMSCTEGQVGGTISMGVRVREPSIVTELETSLRDSYRQIRSKRISQADQGQAFPCQFETTVVMRRRPKELYLQPLSERGSGRRETGVQSESVATYAENPELVTARQEAPQ